MIHTPAWRGLLWGPAHAPDCGWGGCGVLLPAPHLVKPCSMRKLRDPVPGAVAQAPRRGEHLSSSTPVSRVALRVNSGPQTTQQNAGTPLSWLRAVPTPGGAGSKGNVSSGAFPREMRPCWRQCSALIPEQREDTRGNGGGSPAECHQGWGSVSPAGHTTPAGDGQRRDGSSQPCGASGDVEADGNAFMEPGSTNPLSWPFLHSNHI